MSGMRVGSWSLTVLVGRSDDLLTAWRGKTKWFLRDDTNNSLFFVEADEIPPLWIT